MREVLDGSQVSRAMFGAIAGRYAGPASLLSLGRYGAWRRALVRALDLAPGARVLDVASGTGLIARAIERRHGSRVVGVDLSESMLARGSGARAVGDARRLPFPDGAFDGVVFSYLLRYVDDPPGTLAEMARVLRPGGVLGSVEFGVPAGRLARAGWRAYARGAFPVLCRAFGPGWREVGGFLGPSIEEWSRRWPLARQVDAWRAAGVGVGRARAMTLGTGVVIVGRKR